MRVVRGHRIWIAAIVAVVLVLVVLSITVVPGLLVDPPTPARLAEMTAKERLDAQNDIRQTLLQAIAGLVLLAGGVATWENVRIARSRRHLEERGQVTERFTRAVDQLGHATSEDVHIGGIYALERIARDSTDDRIAVAEVLAAFVRGHAAPATFDAPDDGASSDGDGHHHWGRHGGPTPDVRAALTVLGRLPPNASGDRYAFDLGSTDLRGVNLAGANLAGANLALTNLANAYLEGVDLSAALLVSADLMGANLMGANLTGAYLTAASLRGANLEGADFAGAQLAGAVADVWTNWGEFDWESAAVMTSDDDVGSDASSDQDG